MTNKQQHRTLTPEVYARKTDRLNHLEEQAATFGIEVPAHIATEIKNLQAELALADIVARPLDARLTAAVKQFDPNELIARFVGEHARRLLAIEQWQTARDQGLKEDGEQRVERQRQTDERFAKIDVNIRTLTIIGGFTVVMLFVVLLVMLVR